MLLTLLAILTGLSWQSSGVSACEMPVTTHISAATALATVQQAKVEAVLARPAEAISPVWLSIRTVAPKKLTIARMTGARVRIDRARE
jgi:hypothetical protein